MTAEPLKLITDKVKIEQSVIEEAERLLADAREGRIDSFIAVAGLTGGGWRPYKTGSMKFPETIGLIEIAKVEWIRDYLKD